MHQALGSGCARESCSESMDGVAEEVNALCMALNLPDGHVRGGAHLVTLRQSTL